MRFSKGRRVRIGAQFSGENLERDRAIEARVAGLVDLTHAPGADQPENLVGAQPRARSQGHGRSCGPLHCRAVPAACETLRPRSRHRATGYQAFVQEHRGASAATEGHTPIVDVHTPAYSSCDTGSEPTNALARAASGAGTTTRNQLHGRHATGAAIGIANLTPIRSSDR